MKIKGLENNYYLTNNDIWISIDGFEKTASLLELKVNNITSNYEFPVFRLYPSPNNEFKFNISQIVRALMPNTNHININNLQNFDISFLVKFEDNFPDEHEIINKYFVRGGRNKNGNDEWYLSPYEELIVGKWIEWKGIDIPIMYAKRIQGTEIVDYIPNNTFIMNVRNSCDCKIIKFLNSLGGYQFYVFEKFEVKTKAEKVKIIPNIINRLRKDNFRTISNEVKSTIEFYAKTPFEIQSVITDLISSIEVLLYNPYGSDDDSKWQRICPETNESIENNYDRVYENKIVFSFSNYITKI